MPQQTQTIVQRLKNIIHGIGIMRHLSSTTPMSNHAFMAHIMEAGGIVWSGRLLRDDAVNAHPQLVANSEFNPLGAIVTIVKVTTGVYTIALSVISSKIGLGLATIANERGRVRIDWVTNTFLEAASTNAAITAITSSAITCTIGNFVAQSLTDLADGISFDVTLSIVPDPALY